MDGIGIGVGPIVQKLFPNAPRLEKQPDAPTADAKQSFQVEAATIEISAKLNYVQLTGNVQAGDPQADTAQQLLDKVKQWVHDLFDKNGVKWQDMSPAEAQQKVSDGGDQSPDAVSKRILDFVKGFDDGTDGRRQLLRDAVEQGFKEAGDAWGSKLPDISYKTMDKVRSGLDGLFGAAAQPATQPAQPTAPQQPSVDLAA